MSGWRVPVQIFTKDPKKLLWAGEMWHLGLINKISCYKDLSEVSLKGELIVEFEDYAQEDTFELTIPFDLDSKKALTLLEETILQHSWELRRNLRPADPFASYPD